MTHDVSALRDYVFTLVSTSRQQLMHGHVDLSDVETAVRSYCEALAALPLEEGRAHVADLQALSEEMITLETELKSARTHVQHQINELGARHKAFKAYQKTDSIGQKFFAPEGENDDE